MKLLRYAAPLILLTLALNVSAATGSCTSADGVVIQNGERATPSQGTSLNQQDIFYTCSNGQWLKQGVTPTTAPTLGTHTVSSAAPTPVTTKQRVATGNPFTDPGFFAHNNCHPTGGSASVCYGNGTIVYDYELPSTNSSSGTTNTPPPPCTPSNICSNGTVINSCTGAVVNSCVVGVGGQLASCVAGSCVNGGAPGTTPSSGKPPLPKPTTCTAGPICVGSDLYTQTATCQQTLATQCSFGCTSNQCITSTTSFGGPTAYLEGQPPLVKKGSQCQLSFSAHNVTGCTLSGDGITLSVPAQNGIVASSTTKSPAIFNTTTYTLSCTGAYTVTKSIDCKVAPTFEEF